MIRLDTLLPGRSTIGPHMFGLTPSYRAGGGYPYPAPPGFVWQPVTFQSQPVTFQSQPVFILQGA